MQGFDELSFSETIHALAAEEGGITQQPDAFIERVKLEQRVNAQGA
jgi:hypothetical protein